jgi:hypothetical protein
VISYHPHIADSVPANRRAGGSCGAYRTSSSGSHCRRIALSSRLLAGVHGYQGRVSGRQMTTVLSVWARRTATDGAKVLPAGMPWLEGSPEAKGDVMSTVKNVVLVHGGWVDRSGSQGAYDSLTSDGCHA